MSHYVKWCTRCETEKPIGEFHKRKSSADGLRSWCKACDRESTAGYDAAHREQKRQSERERYLKNRARILSAIREYSRQHPEVVAARHRRRRARKAGVGGSLTADEWQAILDRFGHRCLCCGTSEDITCDHVIPLAEGGAHSADNVQPLCRKHNAEKHTKIIDYRPSTP